mgnify:CR=1 FL=1
MRIHIAGIRQFFIEYIYFSKSNKKIFFCKTVFKIGYLDNSKNCIRIRVKIYVSLCVSIYEIRHISRIRILAYPYSSQHWSEPRLINKLNYFFRFIQKCRHSQLKSVMVVRRMKKSKTMAMTIQTIPLIAIQVTFRAMSKRFVKTTLLVTFFNLDSDWSNLK